MEAPGRFLNRVAVTTRKKFEQQHYKTISTKRKRCIGLVVLMTLVIIVIVLVIVLLRPSGAFYSDCVGRAGAYKNLAISSDAPICSTIGKEVLSRSGASVVDGAIAALLCVGLLNSHSMGIGGGFFANIYIRGEKKVYTLDAREVAPLVANKDMFIGAPEKAKIGGSSIAVPGEVAGYWELHQKFGKLPWRDLFKPTIELCRNGVVISKELYRAMVSQQKRLMNNSVASEMFKNPHTIGLRDIGDLVKYEKLAKTLEGLAELGVDHFYKGDLAKQIVKEIQGAGGIVSEEDLLEYKPKWRDPVITRLPSRGTVLGHKMAAMPPPSSGVLVQFILKTLAGYHFDLQDLVNNNRIATYHKILEVAKFAYGVRAHLCDIDYDYTNVSKLIKNIQSDEYMNEVRFKINESMTLPDAAYGQFQLENQNVGTSHLSIMERNGDAISITSSVNHYFGSKVFGKETGIIYNNHMDDFSIPGMKNFYGLPPSDQNFAEPGKRPMSSMSPVIIVDEHDYAVMAVGASGGSRIIVAVATVLIHNLLFKEQLKDAIDAPRIYEQWLPNTTLYETELDEDIISGLQSRGHLFRAALPNVIGGVVQAVERRDGWLNAYADKRKSGCVDGE